MGGREFTRCTLEADEVVRRRGGAESTSRSVTPLRVGSPIGLDLCGILGHEASRDHHDRMRMSRSQSPAATSRPAPTSSRSVTPLKYGPWSPKPTLSKSGRVQLSPPTTTPEERRDMEKPLRELLRKGETPENITSLTAQGSHLLLYSLAPLAQCACLRRLDASRNSIRSLEVWK
jgi:hypothetical protein